MGVEEEDGQRADEGRVLDKVENLHPLMGTAAC